MIPQLLIKADEAAKLLSMSKRKLWSLTEDGTIQCLKVGRSVFYCPRYLARWIDQQLKSGGGM
ncbi:helix-turn-helix domain-containing protein [Mariniblastus fucicola]|uniref:Helix-turn-helix domain protein n=1 Tax=Mariniblastus fucicola TaxID=980251 RepID=A0A5B9PSE4_9BACT|nr:Helix-turn-helix domain protein [Mariniblastus fucicola]